MTMLHSLRNMSFRTRLVALLLVVEALALAFLVWQGTVLEMQKEDREFESILQRVRPLLNAAVQDPLARRDLGLLKTVLQDSLKARDLAYVAVKDSAGELVATAGDVRGPLPRLDAAMEDGFSDHRYDTAFPIVSRGRPVGTMQVGVSLEREMTGLDESFRDNVYRSLIAFGISVLLFLVIIQPFARRLGRLQRAAERIAKGDYAVDIEDDDTDEVGLLARAFARMTDVVRARIEDLDRSRSEFHAIADYTYDVECWMTPGGELQWINSSVERVTGYTAAECLERKHFPWFPLHDDDVERVRREYVRALRDKTTASGFEFRIVRKDGGVEWVANSWQPIYDADNKFQGLRLSYYSIQQLKDVELDLRETLAQLEEANERQSATALDLRSEQSRLLSLLSAMSFGVVFVDRGERIVYANPAFTQTWSIAPHQALLGVNLFYALKNADDTAVENDQFVRRLAELLADQKGVSTTEIRLVSGKIVRMQVCPVLDGERQFQGSVLIFEDITQARESQNQLAFLAERDPLTGLFNRRRFERELAERIEAAARARERVALLFFDLDEFKSVNDLFGHRMGDQVLVQVAGEIRAQLRRNEFFARIGGDEFALIVNFVDDQTIRSLADRLMRVVGGLSISLGEVRLSLTSSLGIAMSPDHSADALELISHADAAMYQAKDAGKNTWRVFQSDHAATLRQRSLVTWNDRIRHALRHDAFEIHLQGVFDTMTQRLRYSEALLRMPDESTGRLLPPSQFIHYAEKSNLIVDIDRWTLGAVIDLLASERNRAPVAVNVSGRSLDEPEIAEFIALKLRDRNVDPERLYIEITETAAINDMRDAQRFIEKLHAIGCKVSLDDFGAGFATFAYIKELPVDVLKIDGLFIRNLAKSRENQVFVRAMLDIARGFRKLTVAEQVEDEACLEMLRSYGVDMVQGFALERPQPAITSGKMPRWPSSSSSPSPVVSLSTKAGATAKG